MFDFFLGVIIGTVAYPLALFFIWKTFGTVLFGELFADDHVVGYGITAAILLILLGFKFIVLPAGMFGASVAVIGLVFLTYVINERSNKRLHERSETKMKEMENLVSEARNGIALKELAKRSPETFRLRPFQCQTFLTLIPHSIRRSLQCNEVTAQS